MTELLLIAIAQAEGAGGQQRPSFLGFPPEVMMMVLMFLVIWFMLIRPQQKRQKEQKSFLDALKRGDKVITSGGIHGSIQALTDKVVTLEIAKDTRIKVTRGQIAGAQAAPAAAEGSAGGASAKKKKARG
jgi:preprotein translocase subunit YajC